MFILWLYVLASLCEIIIVILYFCGSLVSIICVIDKWAVPMYNCQNVQENHFYRFVSMPTLSISLPDSLNQFVQQQMAAWVDTIKNLEEKLLKGLHRGETEPWTDESKERIWQEAQRRLEQKRAGTAMECVE